jgi:hypothetical protein
LRNGKKRLITDPRTRPQKDGGEYRINGELEDGGEDEVSLAASEMVSGEAVDGAETSANSSGEDMAVIRPSEMDRLKEMQNVAATTMNMRSRESQYVSSYESWSEMTPVPLPLFHL